MDKYARSILAEIKRLEKQGLTDEAEDLRQLAIESGLS